MQLSDELQPVALELTAWARRTACVRRVWIFGSRARGDHNPASDVDVAIAIDPIGTDENAEVSFIATASEWRAELDPRIPFKLHLQWYDPNGSTPAVQDGVETSGILVYERQGNQAMTSGTSLTWRGFWVGVAVLFGLLFLLNYHLYVMPDALSVTVGSLVGSFIFAWIVWRVTKFVMKERAPESRFLVLVAASLSVFASAYPGIIKLMA